MSLRPSDSDHIDKILESARRDVRQLEIDAARIRTDLALLEAANAIGVLDSEVAPVLEETVIDAPTAPVTRSSSDAVPSAVEWQPAAPVVPDGMEILIGEETPADAPLLSDTPVEPELLASESLENENPELPESVSRPGALYRRLTSPMVTSLALHAAILVLTLSISVAAIDRESQFARTVLSLGDKPTNEAENIDVHQLADLGQTPSPMATDVAPQLESIASASVGPTTTPIDVRPLDAPGTLSQMGIPSALTTD